MLVLVTFRIIWGLVGTRHARFWSFLRNPVATLRYALDLVRGNHEPTVGHNPLGAWMILLLLLAVLAQSIVGLFGNDEIYNLGPLNGYVSNDLGIALTSWHRKLFYIIVSAVAVHIAAIVYHRVALKENLVGAMITGRKSADVVPPEQAVTSSRTVLALTIVTALAALLAWVVRHAPAPQAFDSFN